MLVDKITKGLGNDPVMIPNALIQGLPKPKPLQEIGVTGLLRTKGVGYVYEEWLRDLTVHRQKQVYREMRDNDAVIGSMFFAIEMILRRASWNVEPAKGRKGDEYAEFVKGCMEDMSHTWEDFIAECVNIFTFGFSLFECVYKRRDGPKGKKASKFDDGLIGWRKFSPRAQESILYWIWDDDGGLQGAVQLAAPDYHTIAMPIEKLLLFRTTSQKNNPEGRSILRNCYRPWFFKRRIEEVEGIGIERDLCGIPVLYANAEVLDQMGGAEQARRLVTNIRADDQAGVVLPLAYDERGKELVRLELLRAAGAKQTNPDNAIRRYNQDMLNTILSGFIQFGQTPTGSRSLHISATQIFANALAAFMDSVAAVINRIAIPRLLSLNSMDLKVAPKLVPDEIGVRDLTELGTFISSLSQSGMTFFDRPTQDYLRKASGLPELPEEDDMPPPMPGMPGALPGQLPGQPQPGQFPGQLPEPKPQPEAGKERPKGSAAPSGEADAEDKLEEAV